MCVLGIMTLLSPACFAIGDKSDTIPVMSDTKTNYRQSNTETSNNSASKTDEKSLENSPIKTIQFEGNKLIKDSSIMANMKMQTGEVYSRELIQQNLKSIYKMGYFSEKMKAIPLKNPDGSVTLKIYVEENKPVTDFTVEGNTVLNSGEILNVLMDLIGMPQNVDLINESIAKIEDLYASQGYILSRVISVDDDPDGVVNFIISEGKIKSINFEGNQKTKNFIIKRNILSQADTIYNENQIKSDLMRLYATQAFKDVTRTITQDIDDPEYYNVTIVLEEQRTGTITLGGGADTATGFFATLGYSENNLFGNGQRLSGNLMAGTGVIMSDRSVLNRGNMQAEISFFEPRLRGTDNSLLVKTFFRDFSSYQIPLAIEQRYGGEITVSRAFKSAKNLSGSFGIGGENIHMKEGDYSQIRSLYAQHGIPISERAKQLSGGVFMSLSPSLVYDTRNSMTFAREGTLATLRFDEMIGVTDLNNSHGKLTASIKKFFPVAKKSSLILSARAGGKLWGDMPEVTAYRLGGPYTVRGFNISGVGTGQGFMMASAEVQTPLLFLDRIKKAPFLENVKLGFFADAGQVYNPALTDKIYDRPEKAISIGTGLRVFIPGVGPLSIDYGYPITNVGKGNSRGLFTFGVGEFF